MIRLLLSLFLFAPAIGNAEVRVFSCEPEWAAVAMEIGGEVFDPLTLDLTDAHNLHMQQVVRVSDGARQGMGVLEHLCVGPYEPYGFTDFFSGVSL